MIAKLALPDEVADCLADGDHGRLKVGHGVAVLALLVQDDQLAHLHTRVMVTVVTGDIAIKLRVWTIWRQSPYVDSSPAGPRAPECWRWFLFDRAAFCDPDLG